MTKRSTKSKARPNSRAPLNKSARGSKKLAAKPNADAALFHTLNTFNEAAKQHEAANAETDRLAIEVQKKLAAIGITGLTSHFDRKAHEFASTVRLSAMVARGGKTNIRKKTKEIRDYVKAEADNIEAAREKGNRIVKRIQRETGLESARQKRGALYVKAAKALETAFIDTPAKTPAGVRAKLDAFKEMSGFEYWRDCIIDAISHDVSRLNP